MTRGSLRIYLGAAPGVGKTYAMLDEGLRRRERGADVVIGFVETHGRPRTAERLGDLEVVPRRRVAHRGDGLEELDLDAVLARRPQVVLVDELAHTNAPGGAHAKRWQDVEALLAAGINVISTVNVQHFESVNDVVERITGVRELETVPDAVVRQAEQVELVDMTPEALRRRMAHGNVYPAERIDAALSNSFRPGNLAALRELALLWVADKVDESLQEYLQQHGIDARWETRERIVVAVSGAPGGDELIRRAARLAARVRADLVALHVAAVGRRVPAEELGAQRTLVRDLGGTYHELVDDDPAAAIVAFARGERATQIVLGATARTRWQRLIQGGIVEKVVRGARHIDVHIISGRPGVPRSVRHRARRGRGRSIPLGRRLLALGLGSAVLAAATGLLTIASDHIEVSTVYLTFLVITVAVAVLGGALVGVVFAVAAFLVENFFFLEPRHTFWVTEAEHIVSLFGFLAFTAAASTAAHRLAARGRDAEQARAEAEALARTAGSLAGGTETLPALVDNIRTTFSLDAVALLTRPRNAHAGRRVDDGPGWRVAASSGAPVPASPEEGEAFTVDDATQLVLVGERIGADLRRLIGAFVGQAAAAIQSGRLRQEAARAEVVAQGDALRVGLLRSVSHDLRTPLAAIKASVSTLLQDDVAWSAAQQREFLVAIYEESDRLDRLVTNLLDASRLQAGAVSAVTVPTALDDVVAAALASLPALPVALDIDLPATLPLVDTDPVLLERVVANLLANAARYAPAGSTVRVSGGVIGERVELLVIDRGRGIAPKDRSAALRPFQRLGDSGGGTGIGVGLGLAVVHGLVELLGGEVRLDDTPGGGLTVTVGIPKRIRTEDTVSTEPEGVAS